MSLIYNLYNFFKQAPKPVAVHPCLVVLKGTTGALLN